LGGADHQRKGLRLDFTDAAVALPVGVVGVVQHDVPQLVGQRLDLRGVVHVGAHRHHAGGVVGLSIGAANRDGVRHVDDGEASGLDLLDQPLA
jgi:hypothetical protein